MIYAAHHATTSQGHRHAVIQHTVENGEWVTTSICHKRRCGGEECMVRERAPEAVAAPYFAYLLQTGQIAAIQPPLLREAC